MAKKTKKSRKNSKPNVFKQTTATNSTIDTNTETSIVENKLVNKKVDLSIFRKKELVSSNMDILTICKKTLELMEKKKIYSDSC